jgi:hypothetical protein
MNEQIYTLIVGAFLVADVVVCLCIKYERNQARRERKHDAVLNKTLFAKRQNPKRSAV